MLCKTGFQPADTGNYNFQQKSVATFAQVLLHNIRNDPSNKSKPLRNKPQRQY